MAFTLYRVTADYSPARPDAVGPGWVCDSYDEAVALAVDLKENRRDLDNVVIKVSHWG